MSFEKMPAHGDSEAPRKLVTSIPSKVLTVAGATEVLSARSTGNVVEVTMRIGGQRVTKRVLKHDPAEARRKLLEQGEALSDPQQDSGPLELPLYTILKAYSEDRTRATGGKNRRGAEA